MAGIRGYGYINVLCKHGCSNLDSETNAEIMKRRRSAEAVYSSIIGYSSDDSVFFDEVTCPSVCSYLALSGY